MAKEWLQQWYVSARRVGITNLLVIATDTETYEWAQVRIGRHVLQVEELVPLLQSDRWGEKKNQSSSVIAFNWRSKGYEEVVVQRATIILSILRISSIDLVYADTDLHWLMNPQSHLKNKYSNYHLCLQREKGDELGDYNCSGFMYFKNTKLVLKFVAAWEEYIKLRLMKKGFFTDQEEINALLRDLILKKRSTNVNSSLMNEFKACTFDWDEFPSGINYFFVREKGKGKLSRTCSSKKCKILIWQRAKRKGEKRPSAYIVHHNFAKTNKEKVTRAKEHGLWLDLNPREWGQRIT